MNYEYKEVKKGTQFLQHSLICQNKKYIKINAQRAAFKLFSFSISLDICFDAIKNTQIIILSSSSHI